jgi:hypothetical protein
MPPAVRYSAKLKIERLYRVGRVAIYGAIASDFSPPYLRGVVD